MTAERHAHLPPAGVSIDLDNLWSYQRFYGIPSWREFPSFLDRVIPRVIDTLSTLGLTATVFIVGRDAEAPGHSVLLNALLNAGHDLQNHSYDHHPDFAGFDAERLHADFARSENAISRIAETKPQGFRAPSFAISDALTSVLLERGYRYDSSVLLSSAGPLAKKWEHFKGHNPTTSTAATTSQHGRFLESWRPQSSYKIGLGGVRELYELPVSTMPVSRLPVQWTYLNFLADMSPLIASGFLRTHLTLAKRSSLRPQLLLHGLDFIGADDDVKLDFMPGMKRRHVNKLAFLRKTLRMYQRCYRLLALSDFVDELADDSPSA